ncbi:MAG: hypothetical protein U1A77_06230 [Pirellulales bacterium]
MTSEEPAFPYFIAVPPRDLTSDERQTVLKLLENAKPKFSEQVATLQVVGRCGCGECPTIFFEPVEPSDREEDLSSYAGTDKEGGVVGVVLMQKQGRLSQLEFFSAGGHDPWSPPLARDLKPCS